MTVINEQALKNMLLPLVAQEKTHPKELYPTAIWKLKEVRFFDLYNNTYDGWFTWVQYADGLFEVWFIVDIRGGLSDDDWHLEKIT